MEQEVGFLSIPLTPSKYFSSFTQTHLEYFVEPHFLNFPEARLHMTFLRLFLLFPECADTVQLITAGSLKKWGFLGLFFPAVRFEPGAAGYEARRLPLCYAVPPDISLTSKASTNTYPNLTQPNLTSVSGASLSLQPIQTRDRK